MVFILIAIIDSKQMFSSILSHSSELTNEIIGLINYFNTHKLLRMIRHRGFVQLLTSYLSQPDILRRILKHKEKASTMKAYVKQIEHLQYICAAE
mmetsp:Transcript_7196/g.8178  ORF Transcript_7196/g.8178 Transcript_7196/m.8178 type:complete len:95 (-) Transcript_7196:55-339(-)